MGKELEGPQGWASAPTLPQLHPMDGAGGPTGCTASITREGAFTCATSSLLLNLCFLHSFHEHGHPHRCCPHRKWLLPPPPGGLWGQDVWRGRPPFGAGLWKRTQQWGCKRGSGLHVSMRKGRLPHSRKTRASGFWAGGPVT